MIDTLLTIILGAVAGLATYLSCIAIWGLNPALHLFKNKIDKTVTAQFPSDTEPFGVSEGTIMRLSIDIKQQELALAKDGTTVSGSYINIERNKDGMQINNKIFLN